MESVINKGILQHIILMHKMHCSSDPIFWWYTWKLEPS